MWIERGPTTETQINIFKGHKWTLNFPTKRFPQTQQQSHSLLPQINFHIRRPATADQRKINGMRFDIPPAKNIPRTMSLVIHRRGTNQVVLFGDVEMENKKWDNKHKRRFM